jgi:hypothetical protein
MVAQSTYAFFLIHWLSLLFSSVFKFRGFHMQTSKAKVFPVNEIDTPSDLKDRKEEDFIDIKDISKFLPSFVDILHCTQVIFKTHFVTVIFVISNIFITVTLSFDILINSYCPPYNTLDYLV